MVKKVLFICVHNSARSQMAEAYLRRFGGTEFEVESAGLEPGKLNPYVVRALAEDGFDISGKKTQGVFDLYKAGQALRLRDHGLLQGSCRQVSHLPRRHQDGAPALAFCRPGRVHGDR